MLVSAKLAFVLFFFWSFIVSWVDRHRNVFMLDHMSFGIMGLYLLHQQREPGLYS